MFSLFLLLFLEGRKVFTNSPDIYVFQLLTHRKNFQNHKHFVVGEAGMVIGWWLGFPWNFPGKPVVDAIIPMQRARFQPLVLELRFHLHWGMPKTKTKKNSSLNLQSAIMRYISIWISIFEQTLGNGEGQGSLACCSPWGCKELDRTEQLDNNNLGIHLSVHIIYMSE